jgi:phasin family protein
MFSKPEQLAQASQALFDAQMRAFQNLTGKAVGSVQQLLELNSQAAKANAEETLAAVQQLALAKSPQAFFALSAEQARANAERTLAYSRHMKEIAQGLQADLHKTSEAQLAEVKNNVNKLMSEMSKNAPDGSAQALALLKNAIEQGNSSFEQITKASEDAMVTLEEQVAQAAEQFSKAVEASLAQLGKK